MPMPTAADQTPLLDDTCRRWGRGQLFAASACDLSTDHERGLIARSVEDGLEIVHPARGHLRFATDGELRFGCDWLEAQTPEGPVRLAFRSPTRLVVAGPVSWSGEDLRWLESDRQHLLVSDQAADEDPAAIELEALIARRRRWVAERLAALPAAVRGHPLAPKLLQQMKGQVCSPEGLLRARWTTPDRWPHRHCWLWDSAFHAVGWRHLDPALAREQLTAVLATVGDDGFIAHCIRPDGTSGISQPPILAWAVERVLEVEDDDGWLATCYPALSAFLRWFPVARRAHPDGLLQWRTNPDNPHNPCDESGWDNSTRFDGAPLLDAIDLNAFFARECAVMARFAARLDRQPDAAAWRERHRSWNRVMNERCWNPDQGLYADSDTASGRPRPIRSPAGLLPLVCGAPDRARVDALVAAIHDPAVFAAPAGLPTVALADQAGLRDAGDMWRGPVWINLHHQVVEGLEAVGRRAEATRLARATVDLMTRWYRRSGTIYEYYDCHDRIPPAELPRKGRNDPAHWVHQPIHDYGWSATLGLDLLLRFPDGAA